MANKLVHKRFKNFIIKCHRCYNF